MRRSPGMIVAAAALAIGIVGCGDQPSGAPKEGGPGPEPRPVANAPVDAPPVRKPATPYSYGFVGAAFATPTAESAKEAGIPASSGAVVVEVTTGEAAAGAGLQSGDIVLSLNGKPVPDAPSLITLLRNSAPGDKVRFGLARGRSRLELPCEVRERSVPRILAQLQESGAAWLVKQQLPGGAWPHAAFEWIEEVGNPSISYTAVCLDALAGLPPAVRDRFQEPIGKATAYLLAHVGEDGGLLDPEEQSATNLRNFASAFAIHALSRLDPEKHRAAIGKLADFLLKRQLTETNGFKSLDWQYGGWTYYEKLRSFAFRTDLVGNALVLRGLACAGIDPQDPCWAKARMAVERSQNFDPERRSDTLDGGFYFNPRSSKAGEQKTAKNTVHFLSYGSTTCDGLAALLHARADAKSPRIVAAFDWLQRNYTLKENPGFAPDATVRFQDGIYFYYLFGMSQALAALNAETLRTPDGTVHYWIAEITMKLRAMQRADGSWKNELNVMSEDDPIVATALSVLCLDSAGGLLRP